MRGDGEERKKRRRGTGCSKYSSNNTSSSELLIISGTFPKFLQLIPSIVAIPRSVTAESAEFGGLIDSFDFIRPTGSPHVKGASDTQRRHSTPRTTERAAHTHHSPVCGMLVSYCSSCSLKNLLKEKTKTNLFSSKILPLKTNPHTHSTFITDTHSLTHSHSINFNNSV